MSKISIFQNFQKITFLLFFTNFRRTSDQYGGGPEVNINNANLEMTQDNNVPIMEAYDQSTFIEKRNKKIKQIKNEAQNLNSLATEINGKVHQQDEKLDTLNKELDYNVEELHKANKDLEKAAKVGGGNHKCLIFALLFLVAIVAGVAVTFFLV